MIIYYYCCNLCKNTLKKGVFCIFKGDATISETRDPDIRNQRPKIRIGKVVCSYYHFLHPKPRFEWTNSHIHVIVFCCVQFFIKFLKKINYSTLVVWCTQKY